MNDRILLDIVLKVNNIDTGYRTFRQFLITFIFPKMNKQLEWKIDSRITAGEFIRSLAKFMSHALSLLMTPYE